MAVPGEDSVPGKQIWWWCLYNKNIAGFDFNKMYIDAYYHPSSITFSNMADAFTDFTVKNAGMVGGEGHNGCCQYDSGRKSKYWNGMVHIILEKADGVGAIIVSRTIVDPSLSPKIPTPVDPVILTELEELRRENAKLRIKIDPSKAPKRDTFYVPPVETLKNTRDIANAFATFFGCFIMSYSSNRHLVEHPQTGTGFGASYIVDLFDRACHPLWFKTKTIKTWAMLFPVAKILGLTKETFQKSICGSAPSIDYTTSPPSLYTYAQRLLLEHIEFDMDIKEQTYQMGFAQYVFKSNLPLLRYLYESVKNIPANEARIGEWVNCLDQEQAECMLRAMAATTTDTFTEIQTISSLLCADIHTLCRIAGYTYECENIFDRLWMFTIKKTSICGCNNN